MRGVLERRRPTDEAAQARLLEISGDVVAIGELAGDVIAPHHTMDGSPMLTSQAAAVVAAYHHLVGIVDVLSPERRSEVMQNLAAATTNLNPQVVMQMLAGGAEEGAVAADGAAAAVVPGLIGAMDDARVAQLLATTLAIEGQASERLATVFNTIATDDDRKRRVLSMTRRMLGETDFGRQDAFQNAVVVDGRAAAHLQRAAVRLADLPAGTGSDRRAGGTDVDRGSRRISWSWSTRSGRTTCGGCRCGC